MKHENNSESRKLRQAAGRLLPKLIIKLLRNIVLVLLCIVFVSILYNFNNKGKSVETETALISEAISSQQFKGVFIRKEKVVTYSGNGILSYNIADGGKAGSGTVIAEVYPDDVQITRNRQIKQLENELSILEKIQNPGTLESAQPSGLSENISESYRTLLYNRDMKDYTSLKKEMESLLVNMSTYQIITQQVTGFQQQIIDLNAQLAELKSSASAPTETIISDESAYFVSYSDGYETELTPENLDKLTIEQLGSIEDRESEDRGIAGKLIDGYSWYLAGVIDNSRKEYTTGNYVDLKFDTTDDVFEAIITDIRDDGDPSRSIIIVKCNRFSEELVAHRAQKCEIIKGEYIGLKVPREAIRFAPTDEETTNSEGEPDGGIATVNSKGVYIMKGEQVVFKKIDVKYEGSDYVLSKIHDDDSSYLALYDDIMIKGEDLDE
ncbi:MAG: hypothetical protein K2J37_02980 [Ruminococcus sp.]|nr:hypothetical protein [Ruminococcus sp.]MDE6783879.1 hypothetical protein [Ruminococcus sp.]